MSRIVNARIVNTSISMINQDSLTFVLVLKGDHWKVNYGGNVIINGYFVDHGAGLVAMMRIMDVVGVPRWEELIGKYVRIVDEGQNVRVTKIGNVIEDKWFDIDEFFINYNKEYAEDSLNTEEEIIENEDEKET